MPKLKRLPLVGKVTHKVNPPSNTSNSAKIQNTIFAVSALVIIFLFWLIYFKEAASSHDYKWVSLLPTLNASLNTLCFLFLILGYRFIKKGRKSAHIASMLAATFCSALFLISYILYHHFHGDTKFLTEGLIRPVYFFILISHIVLSIPLVPMVFTTLYKAASKNWASHKKWARATFPIWLYVSMTGVLVYIFVKYLNVPSVS